MFKWLIEPTTRGLYFSIDEDSGRAAFFVPFEPHAAGVGVDTQYSAKPYMGTVADLSCNLAKLHPEIKKAFLAWTRQVPQDMLNKLINAQPTPEMRVGDVVRFLGGDGDVACWIYGRVELSGPKTLTVRWENGVRNRFDRAKNKLEFVPDSELRTEIRVKMALAHGVVGDRHESVY